VLVERQPLVTIPLRGSTTTRRRDDATKTKIFTSHFAVSGGTVDICHVSFRRVVASSPRRVGPPQALWAAKAA